MLRGAFLVPLLSFVRFERESRSFSSSELSSLIFGFAYWIAVVSLGSSYSSSDGWLSSWTSCLAIWTEDASESCSFFTGLRLTLTLGLKGFFFGELLVPATEVPWGVRLCPSSYFDLSSPGVSSSTMFPPSTLLSLTTISSSLILITLTLGDAYPCFIIFELLLTCIPLPLPLPPDDFLLFWDF